MVMTILMSLISLLSGMSMQARTVVFKAEVCADLEVAADETVIVEYSDSRETFSAGNSDISVVFENDKSRDPDSEVISNKSFKGGIMFKHYGRFTVKSLGGKMIASIRAAYRETNDYINVSGGRKLVWNETGEWPYYDCKIDDYEVMVEHVDDHSTPALKYLIVTYEDGGEEVKEYDLTIACGDGGSVKVTDVATGDEVKSGSKVKENIKLEVTASADEGYVLNSLKVNGSAVSSPAEVTVTSNIAIEAVFSEKEAETAVITLEVNDPELGAIIAKSEGKLIESGSTLKIGSSVRLEFLSRNDGVFRSATINGAPITPTDEEGTLIYTYPLAGDTKVSAVFEKDEPDNPDDPEKEVYKFVCNAGLHGKVSVTDSEGNEIASGAEVKADTRLKAKITPEEGYVVAMISLNGEKKPVGNGEAQELEFVITDNTTLDVGFVKIEAAIEVSTDKPLMGEVYINSEGTVSYAGKPGDKVTIHAVASEGCKFVEWELDGETYSENSVETVTLGSAAMKICAKFGYLAYQPHNVNLRSTDKELGTIELLEPYNITSDIFTLSAVTARVVAVAHKASESDMLWEWKDGDGMMLSLDSLLIIAGDKNIEAIADFRKVSPVECEQNIGGDIEIADGHGLKLADKSVTAAGTRLTLTIRPLSNYRVDYVVINEAVYMPEDLSGGNANQTMGETLTHTLITGRLTTVKPYFTTTTGMIATEADCMNSEVTYYTIDGRRLGTVRPVNRGLYIVRSGSTATKLLIP